MGTENKRQKGLPSTLGIIIVKHAKVTKRTPIINKDSLISWLPGICRVQEWRRERERERERTEYEIHHYREGISSIGK